MKRTDRAKVLLAAYLLPGLFSVMLLNSGCSAQKVLPTEDPQTAETSFAETETGANEAKTTTIAQPKPVSPKQSPEPSPLSAMTEEPSAPIEEAEAPPLPEAPSPLPPEPEKAPPEIAAEPESPAPPEPEPTPEPSGQDVPSAPIAAESAAIPVTTLQPAENAPQEGLRLLDSFIATAYYLTGLTSTGAYTTVNHTLAVNPNIIPYGTHVWIWLEDGTYVGDFYAEDTGSNMMAHPYVIDIYMGNSYDACIQWGARNVLVYVEDEAV